VHLLKQVKTYLEKEDYDGLADLARGQEGKIASALIGFLTDGQEVVKWRAVKALGLVAESLFRRNPDRVRTLIRQLIWNLNDESGNIGWGMPEAFGEILARIPSLKQEYLRLLTAYLGEEKGLLDHPQLQKGVIWAIGRNRALDPGSKAKALSFLKAALQAKDPSLKGTAVWALGELGVEEALDDLKSLQREEEMITLFDGEHLKALPLGGLAQEAVAKTERRKTMAENEWKCSNCGYALKADVPPETCPSCKQKCEFVNVTCYIPECQTTGVDPRLK
jgi:rubredoxin